MRDDGPTYNVLDVWKMGLTGKGIVVAVVDQGLEKNHRELKQNYVSVRTFFSTIHLMSCFNNFDIDHVYEVFSKTDFLGKLCIKKRLSLVDFFEAFLFMLKFIKSMILLDVLYSTCFHLVFLKQDPAASYDFIENDSDPSSSNAADSVRCA